MKVGRIWTPEEIKVAVKQGPHKSELAPDAIKKIYKEAEEKVQQLFAEVVYWNEIERKLGSADWQHLKISPIAVIPHKR